MRGDGGAEVAQTTCCETQLGLDGISNDSGTVRWEIPEPADQKWVVFALLFILADQTQAISPLLDAMPRKTTASVIGFVASQGGSGDYTISTSWHPRSGKRLRS